MWKSEKQSASLLQVWTLAYRKIHYMQHTKFINREYVRYIYMFSIFMCRMLTGKKLGTLIRLLKCICCRFLTCKVFYIFRILGQWCLDWGSSGMGSAPPDKYKFHLLCDLLKSRHTLLGCPHTVDILRGPTRRLGIKLQVLVSVH